MLKPGETIQERERKNLIGWKCHNGLLFYHREFIRGGGIEGGFAPWLAAALLMMMVLLVSGSFRGALSLSLLLADWAGLGTGKSGENI